MWCGEDQDIPPALMLYWPLHNNILQQYYRFSTSDMFPLPTDCCFGHGSRSATSDRKCGAYAQTQFPS